MQEILGRKSYTYGSDFAVVLGRNVEKYGTNIPQNSPNLFQRPPQNHANVQSQKNFHGQFHRGKKNDLRD